MNFKRIDWKIKLILIPLILFSIYSFKKSPSIKTINPSGFEITRGVNLSHWLSQDFGWAPKYTYINENDIRFIDSIGYDHVRIPIDEQEMWDENGKPVKAAFDQLTSCLQWCAKYDLRAIVDLHIIRAHYFNAIKEGGSNDLWEDTAAQNHFIDLWMQLSEVLHEYPNNTVAYELLNEAVAPDNEDWNKLVNKAVAAIREKEPDRVLIIGPNMWQQASYINYLKVPENDRNIILSFHTYTPLVLTHHLAEWTPAGQYEGPVHYPGQIITDDDYRKYVDTSNVALVNEISDASEYFDKDRLIEVFKPAIEYARSKKLQLYCGEFGCLSTIERSDRLQYYADMISAFGENDIAWCNWEYKGDFGIYHFDREKKISLSPDTELINILFQAK